MGSKGSFPVLMGSFHFPEGSSVLKKAAVLLRVLDAEAQPGGG